ncbi:hypothetical protein DL98DRAFT_48706 [Cadophora sp. DSE1049]|nr:hypothetical protein DL98DRAFT_48706 [Cadophora sp. DSE1049]
MIRDGPAQCPQTRQSLFFHCGLINTTPYTLSSRYPIFETGPDLWKPCSSDGMLKAALFLTLAIVSSVLCDGDVGRPDGPADGFHVRREIIAREPQRTTIRIISLYPGLTSVHVRNEPSFPPVLNRPTKIHTSSVSSFTTSPSKPIPTKTGLKNCHSQGTPSTLLNSSILGSQYASDALACQLQCMFVSRCEAYSYQAATTSKTKNCVKYLTIIDGPTKVTSSSSSGIFFSDKYPSDGSNFCYGGVPL